MQDSYDSGMHMMDPSAEKKLQYPLYQYANHLLKPLKLTPQEKKALVSFLESLSGTKFRMKRQEFPVE